VGHSIWSHSIVPIDDPTSVDALKNHRLDTLSGVNWLQSQVMAGMAQSQTVASTTKSPTAPPGPTALANGTARLLRDTPTRLVTLAMLTAVTALVFSAGSFWAVGQRNDSDRAARVDASRILAAQDAQALLTEADALATEGYLSGGLQDQAAQDAFRKNIDEAAIKVTKLPAGDVAAKGIANYVRLASLAQANNRQGLPVGSTYQKLASTTLKTVVIPALKQNGSDARGEFRSSLNRSSDLLRLLILFALPFLLIAGFGSYWLMKTTKRTLNPGLAAALGSVVVVLFLSLVFNSSSRRETLNYARDQFKTADLDRQAKSSLFDARSAENQALIFRGNRSGYDAQWTASMARLKVILGEKGGEGTNTAAVDDYTTAHNEAAQLDLKGNWDGARDSVLTGRTNDKYTALVDVLKRSPIEAAQFPPFRPGRLRALTGIGGLLAAAFAAAGYQARLKEYR
jgi:hypothetical protein